MHDAAAVVFSAIAFILLLLPLPLHTRARNSSTLLQILWLQLGNLLVFTNAILWWDNADNSAIIWCDISTKILIGIPPGLSACSLCINRRLASIAASRSVITTQRQKRISVLIDLLLCVGIPMLIMGLSYVVQPHRCNLFESIGPQPAIYPSLAALFIFYLSPCVMSLVSIVYGAIAVKFFLSRRLQFNAILKKSNSGLDAGHYFRLMSMATADLVLGLPLTLFFFVFTATNLLPWMSFSDLHYDFSYVDQTPASEFGAAFGSVHNFVLNIMPGWLYPNLSFVFFLFFGVTEDAIGEYVRWISTAEGFFRRSLGLQNIEASRAPPKLGSTVINTLGHAWRESFSVKEDMPESPIRSQTAWPPINTQDQKGVSVSVEREVV